jgi:hypothetical protein
MASLAEVYLGKYCPVRLPGQSDDLGMTNAIRNSGIAALGWANPATTQPAFRVRTLPNPNIADSARHK